jgi:hypothetical protein
MTVVAVAFEKGIAEQDHHIAIAEGEGTRGRERRKGGRRGGSGILGPHRVSHREGCHGGSGEKSGEAAVHEKNGRFGGIGIREKARALRG